MCEDAGRIIEVWGALWCCRPDLGAGCGSGFPLALWLSVAQAELAGSDDALAARGLKSDVKVHLASQSPAQFQENILTEESGGLN